VERLILDTTVLVSVERTASSLDAVIDDEDDVAIAAITAAELLVGVELAGAEHKEPRRGLVTGIMEAAGIEPASADAPDRASTSVVRLDSHPTAGGERPTGGPAILWVSRLGRWALPRRRARWLAPGRDLGPSHGGRGLSSQC